MKRVLRTIPLLLLLSLVALSQNTQMVQFRVVLVWADGSNFSNKQDVAAVPGVQGINPGSNAVPNTSIHIAVLNEAGQTLAEKSPSGQGDAMFNLVGTLRGADGTRKEVTYGVRVYGTGIEEEDIQNVKPAGRDKILSVRIRRKGSEAAGADASTTPASALKVPDKAKKEYQRGSEALEAKKYPEARKHFEKAIALYPNYDAAYNELGATLAEMGDFDGAGKAFEKSIQVNDHFAEGYRNLAKIAAHNKDFVRAADLLQRSLAIEPLNPEAISSLAQFDYILGKYHDVPELANRLEGLRHPGEALAHFAAGASLERLNKPDDAVLQYMLFLKEDPDNSLAPAAKAAVERCRQKLNEIQ